MADPDGWTLVLVTKDFPYSYGEQFLESEVPYLAQRFRRVIFVPHDLEGQPRAIPENGEVDPSLARLKPNKLRRLLTPTSAGLFFREAARHPEKLAHPVSVLRILGRISGTIRAYWWFQGFLARYRLDLGRTIFYTYWLSPATLGIGLHKHRYPNLKLVSRAHGHDLYEEQSSPPYLALKAEMLGVVDHLFTISEHGRIYLTGQYGWINDKSSTSRLGVHDSGFSAERSNDGIFRVISCSYIYPVKRLDRLIDGLVVFAQRKPELQIEWNHLGDGHIRSEIEALARARLPQNVRWCFHGQLPNAHVIEFYRTHLVDVLVNVSKSEGLPVSLMEAGSCGIPIIAPRVGGVPEIVSDENGILLDKNPTPQAVADALQTILENPGSKRAASKAMWASTYNAAKNFPDFINRVMRLYE